MSYNYPTPGMSGLQTGYVDQGGYPIKPQSSAAGGYPGQGLSPGGASAAYPPLPPGASGGLYPTDLYSPGGAPTSAYPPIPGQGATAAPSMTGGSSWAQPSTGMYGGASLNDLYTHGQQYGLTRGEVDGALAAHRDIDTMERGMLSSLGLGQVQNLLKRIFGHTTGSDSIIGPLSNTLLMNLSSGRVPGIKDFLSMLGMNKMQYGKPGGFSQQGLGTGVGAMPGMMPSQHQQYQQGLGTGAGAIPGMMPSQQYGKPALGRYPQQQQQYPGLGTGAGPMPSQQFSSMPPY